MNAFIAADFWFENLMLGIRSPLFIAVFKAVALLGEAVVVLIFTIIVGVLLYRVQSLRAYALGLATAVLGGGFTTFVLKYLADRARPGGLIPAVVETSPSFPSEHATLSLALYGFAAFLLCRRFPAKAPLIIGIAACIILAVGASRLYLGAHFPSDVVAGYIVGGAWLIIGMRSAHRLQRAGSGDGAPSL